MKKFKVTVNGSTYEVEVEEIRQDNADEETITVPKVDVPVSQPKPVEKPSKQTEETPQKNAPKAIPAGGTKINAPMPGTILDIRVNEGQNIKKGDVLMILEAMKMENEIIAPQDGRVASINVSKNTSVNTGDVLLVLK